MSEPCIQTAGPHCRWTRWNKNHAKGEAEPGNDSSWPSVHSCNLLCARCSPRPWGYRSGENPLPSFMVTVFLWVSQTNMEDKCFRQEKNSHEKRVLVGGE